MLQDCMIAACYRAACLQSWLWVHCNNTAQVLFTCWHYEVQPCVHTSSLLCSSVQHEAFVIAQGEHHLASTCPFEIVVGLLLLLQLDTAFLNRSMQQENIFAFTYAGV